MNEASKIDKKFNVDYLRAEYDTAINSAEMASHWVRFKQMGDPMLRYVTVGDERVRASHAAMNGIQRPMSDPIWDKIYPPNGWNCRCTVVTTTGAATPGKQIRMPWDVPPMFQTNLAKTGMLWPKDHPYYKASDEMIIKREGNDRLIDNAIADAPSKKDKLQTAGQIIRDVVFDEFGINAQIVIPRHSERIPPIIKLTTQAIYRVLCIREHSLSVACRKAFLFAIRNPTLLQYDKQEEVGEHKDKSDPKAIKNIKRKKKRGVGFYQLYNFAFNGGEYILGCEEYKKNGEHYLQPYFIKTKKSSSL